MPIDLHPILVLILGVYKERCMFMINLLKEHVDPATIDYPKANGGMFLWLRLKIESHPDFPAKSPSEIAKGVFETMISEKVLAVPSLYFRAPSLDVQTIEEEARNTFFRVSFSLPPFDVMVEGVKRLGTALKKEWKL